MRGLLNRNKLLLLITTTVYVFSSCQRNDIEFGTIPENSYTNLVYTDTIDVKLSTILTDSFRYQWRFRIFDWQVSVTRI